MRVMSKCACAYLCSSAAAPTATCGGLHTCEHAAMHAHTYVTARITQVLLHLEAAAVSGAAPAAACGGRRDWGPAGGALWRRGAEDEGHDAGTCVDLCVCVCVCVCVCSVTEMGC